MTLRERAEEAAREAILRWPSRVSHRNCGHDNKAEMEQCDAAKRDILARDYLAACLLRFAAQTHAHARRREAMERAAEELTK